MIFLYPYAKRKLDNNLKEHFTNIILLSINYCPTNFVTAMFIVVQFYPWFNFDFPLFFSMLIYDN